MGCSDYGDYGSEHGQRGYDGGDENVRRDGHETQRPGGGSDDPNVFNKDEVYSTRRITIAPIIILLGIAIEIYAIFRQNKTTTGATE